MILLRKLGFGVSVLIVLVSLLVQAVPAAASAHGPGAGSFSNTSVTADYSLLSPDPSQPQISISVSATTNTSHPLNGPISTTQQTQLYVSVSTDTSESGCFVLDQPSDFRISPGLSGASLHTTLTDTTPTCGSPSSFTLPITLDVTWTGAGPISSTHLNEHSGCVGYHVETVNSFTGNQASATAGIAPLLAGSFTTDQGNLSTDTSQVHVHGIAPDLCMAGGAPGAGSLGAPAGSYRTVTIAAGQELFDSSTQTTMDVSVSTTTKSSNPRVGPSTSTTETDLSLNMFGSTNGSGCYVLTDPTAFTLAKDLSSASVHASVTDSSQSCGPNSLPTPLTVDATWTGLGPSSSTRNSSQGDCAGYRAEASVVDLNNNTSAVATLSDAINESFASVQDAHTSSGSVGSGDIKLHVEGSAMPTGCAGF